MTQEIGTSELLDTWASTGTIVAPDISKVAQGWALGERPAHEFMNWVLNELGQKANHSLSRGVANWNNTTEFTAGAVVNHSGAAWLAVATNTNSEPSDANANWLRLLKRTDPVTLLSASPALRVTYGGTANAITLTTGAGFSGTIPTGLELRFLAGAANTGDTTIAVDGGSPIACRTSATGAVLPAGYIRTAGSGYRETVATYDGTNWIVQASEPVEAGGTGKVFGLTVGSVSTTSNTYATQATATGLAPGLWRVSVFAGVLASTAAKVRVAKTDISAEVTAASTEDNYSPGLFRSGFITLAAGENLILQTARSATSGTAEIREVRASGSWIRDL
jgi:hypothetical protein